MATGDGGGGKSSEDRGPQWVIGLDGTQKLEATEKTEQVGRSADGKGGGGGEPKRRDWLVLVAILVGVVIGVGTWWALLGGPEEPEPVQYTVEAGDTLWKIARGHGVTVGQLREWNGLTGDNIEVGQSLAIYTEPGVVVEGGTRTAPRARSGRTAPRPEGPADDGRLHMPAAKPCLTLDPDTLLEDGDEPAMMASAGLSPEQLRGSTRPFLSELQRCFRPGVPVSGTAVLQVNVGCDGLVSGVVVTDDGGLPAEELTCIKQTVGYAPFPAHDMPDGYTFSWPISLEWPG